MGRRKIEILPIQHDRNRSVTFLKRKNGLFKKAYELGVLCSVDVAVIIFGHNNKVYEYCSTDSDTMVQRRLHYTGERDVKTPADFGGDKANNDDDDDGSDDAGPSRNGKFPVNGKKRGRDDEHHLDYDTPGHLLHLQQHLPPPNPRAPASTPSLPNISSLARGPMPPVPPVSLPIPPYHPHHPSLPQPQSTADALMEREREREREREGALRQLGLHHLLNNQQPAQFAPHPSHPSLVSNLNLAALLQANPLLGLGVPGLNLGLGGLLGAGAGGGAPNGQQDLLAMLSANAANVGQTNALYSNPLFSTLFPNHPNLGGDNSSNSNESPHKPASTASAGGGGGGDIWPSLARPEPPSNSNTSSAPVSSSNANNAGDTSWLSFLGNPRGSQPPTDDVDLSSLFPFDGGIGVGAEDDGEGDERGGKRVKR